MNDADSVDRFLSVHMIFARRAAFGEFIQTANTARLSLGEHVS
jgi:hypothetical protein